jgi:hypothetical protein
VTTAPLLAPVAESGVLAVSGHSLPADARSKASAFFSQYGYLVLRGLYPAEQLEDLDEACRQAQEQVGSGALPERYGTARLSVDATQPGSAGAPPSSRGIVNYVSHLTELVPAARAAALHPAVTTLITYWLGSERWLLEGDPFGVVYQDARPGAESGYTRIGWHSDWQSGPHLDRWPSVAFTVHLDATSPANGFLRVVPGSQQWATPAPFQNANAVPVPAGARAHGGYTDSPAPQPMPLGFDHVPGEVPVFCERGDVLLHDAYLWHSAARATADAGDPAGVRRHIRGGWYARGQQDAATVTEADFVKNAAR